MNEKMTPAEYDQFGRACGSRITEFFDGFAIVGFHAVTKEPVVLTSADDLKTRHALNDLLGMAISPLPVITPDHEPPQEGPAKS